MSGDLDLEQRYRRVLRLLPGYYRDKWEEDMVAAFLDSWMTGDPDEERSTMESTAPARQEIGQRGRPGRPAVPRRRGTPRRYFAWAQLRLALLAVVLRARDAGPGRPHAPDLAPPSARAGSPRCREPGGPGARRCLAAW